MAYRTEIAKYLKENLLLKKQIEDRTGKNGGLMIVLKMPDNTRIEDMQAMLQSMREHGRY